MLLKRIARGIAKGGAAFWKRTNWRQLVFLAFIGSIGVLLMCITISVVVEEAVEDYKFNQLSTAIHLKLAKLACGNTAGTNTTETVCQTPSEAERQLLAIPKTAQEYHAALDLLAIVHEQQARNETAGREKAAQSKVQAYEQMQRNISGQAHDAFSCATSTENKPIISFDAGRDWWADDGRCEATQQRSRDSDAEISSYLSTTLRVNTDMDSFWLPDEERTCQSYPDDKGKIATITCTSTGTHQEHNIPVKFWGGVSRNTTSDWKCRQEKNLLSDEFVCRAVD